MAAFGTQLYKADVAAGQLVAHRAKKDFNPDLEFDCDRELI